MAIAMAIGILVCAAPPSSAGCTTDAEASGDVFIVDVACPRGGKSSEGQSTEVESAASASQPSTYSDVRWVSVCVAFSPSSSSEPTSCQGERQCADPAQRLEELWGYRAQPPREWVLLSVSCRGGIQTPTPAAAAPAPAPTVTPGLVLQALRRIGLPELEVQTQPADETLVNFATIFYAEPQPFARTISLLGQRVQIEASPARFTWDHGDGTSASTDSPGAPYPSKEITHSYSDAGVTVNPSVDVTYTARFRVAGGAWRDIPGSVTISGPATSLLVSEATAVLSGEYD